MIFFYCSVGHSFSSLQILIKTHKWLFAIAVQIIWNYFNSTFEPDVMLVSLSVTKKANDLHLTQDSTRKSRLCNFGQKIVH